MTPSERPRRLNLQQRSALAGEAAAASAEVENALVWPSDPTAAAFFDVDNTVMQGASIFHFARGLYRRKFFTTKEIASAAWKQAYFRIAGVEDPDAFARQWHILMKGSIVAAGEGDTLAAARAREIGALLLSARV